MTASQIKQAYAALPEKAKSSVSAWIRAERLSRDPGFVEELARRNRDMDRGRKWSLAEVRKLSRTQAARGL